MSPSSSARKSITRPVRAYHFCSAAMRSELAFKSSVGPCQLNTSDGVTARIALASVGGCAGSFFSAQRCLPRFSLHSQGDSYVTSGAAAAVLQTRTIAANRNVGARIIATVQSRLLLLAEFLEGGIGAQRIQDRTSHPDWLLCEGGTRDRLIATRRRSQCFSILKK
jgi:hypothetical protein